MSTDRQWRRTSPLAALFFLGKLVKELAKNAVQTLAPLAAFLVAYDGPLSDKLFIIGIGAVLLTIGASILRYLFFRFTVTDDAILIRDGVFNKKQLDIKFDRIQGVNTEQNFIYRWFGLVTVSFDTAGSSGSEGNLPAISLEFADELQDRIDQNKPGTQSSTATSSEALAPEPMLTLDWRDMIRIGLADRRALIIFAFIGPFFEQMGEEADGIISAYAESAFENVSQYGAAGGAFIVFALILMIALILMLASIGAAFWRYHRFELTMDGRVMRSVGGLTTRHRVNTDIGKVQRIRMSQGIMMRWFRRLNLTAQQATSSGKNAESNSFRVPMITSDLAREFGQRVFAGETRIVDLDVHNPDFSPVNRQYLRSRTLVIGVLPAIILSAILWQGVGVYALLVLIWPIIVAGFVRQAWKRLAWMVDEDAMQKRSGLFGYRLDAFLFRKAQRVTVSQSWFQRRKGLATLRIFLASGSAKIPYMSHATACQLRDYILFKVESSSKSWH